MLPTCTLTPYSLLHCHTNLRGKSKRRWMYVLADEKDVNESKVKVVEVRHCGHTLSACMHASVELPLC